MCTDQWGPSPLQTTSSRHTQIIDGDILKQAVSGSHSRQRLLNQVSLVTSLGYQNRKRLKLISPLTAANRQKQKGFSAGKETASPAVSHMNWLEISHQLQYSNTPKQSSAYGSDKSGRHTSLKSPARKGKNAIRNQSLAANLSGCRAQGKPLSVMDLLVYRVSGLELRGAASAGQAGWGRAVIKVPSADAAASNPEVSRGTLYPDPPSPRGRRCKDSEESDSDSKEEGGGGGWLCQGGSSRRSEVRPKKVEVRARRPWVRGLGQVCGPRPQSTKSYDGGDGDRDAQSTWMDRLLRDEACAAGGATRWADSPDMTPGGEWPGGAVYVPKLDLPTTPESSVDHASPRAASRQRGPHQPPCPWGRSRTPSPASDKATPRAPATAHSHRPGQEEGQGAASPEPECRIQELEYLPASDEDLSSPEDNTYFTGKILNISLSFGGRFSRSDVPADIPRIMLTEDEDEEDGSL